MWSAFSALIFLVVLFPKGSLLTNPVHELDYELVEKGRFYSRRISHAGISLKVGSNWETKVTNTDENTVLICSLGSQIFLNNYLPKVQQRIDGTYKPVTNINDYFAVTRKEIWNCKKNTKDKKSIVNRVVTELVSRVEVNQVLHREGVHVTSKELFGGKRSAVILEVKYYNINNFKVMRYDGKVQLPEKYRKNKQDLFRELKSDTRKLDSDGSFKEIGYSQNGAVVQSNPIYRQGSKIIEIGGQVTDTLGNQNSVAECEKFQGMQSNFPFDYRPRVLITTEEEYPMPKILTKDNYTEFLTPLQEEVWFCKDNNNLQFWRVVNDVLSIPQTSLKIIKYYDMVTHLAVMDFIKTRPIYSVRAKVISYYINSAGILNVNYVGRIKLISPKNVQFLTLKSSIDQVNVETREMVYALQPGRVFKSFMSNSGLNIRVGTKWTKSIGETNDVVQCTLKPSEVVYSFEYGTRFRLVLKNSYSRVYTKAVPRSQHFKYWQVIRQQVWICEETGNKKYKFLRVVNELQGKKELYEVEYYDSVQIYGRTLVGTRRTVNLIEIKYIDQDDFKVYKYEGKIKFDSLSETSKNFLDCINCDAQPIEKHENEIVFEDNDYRRSIPHHENRNVEIITYELTDTKANHEKWTMGGSLSFSLGVHPKDLITVGEKTDTIECEEVDEEKSAFHSKMKIFFEAKQGGSTFRFLSINSKNERRDCKVKLLKQIVWFCQKMKDIHQTEPPYKLFRVLNKISISSTMIKEIFFRNGAQMTAKPANDVRILEEIRYLTSGYEEAKYEGSAIILPKLANNRITCGTVDVTHSQFSEDKSTERLSNGPEIVYELEKKRLHKLTIDQTGELEVQLGRSWRWSKIVLDSIDGNKDKIIKCVKNDSITEDTFITEYNTYCGILNENYPQDEDDSLVVFERYFQLKNWEIWDCKDTASANEFRRVVSKFELKRLKTDVIVKPIKEIRYQDGVTVYRGNHATGSTGWLFREVRYTYKDSPHVTIKYLGKLELDEAHIDAHHINEFDSSNCPTCLKNLAERSMSYQLDSDKMFKKVIVYTSKPILKVGSKYEKEIVDTRTFSCMKTVFTGNDYETKVEIASPDDKYLFKYEKLTGQSSLKVKKLSSRSWECSPIDEASNTDQTIKLIRVENQLEIVGSTSVGQLVYYEGVTVNHNGQFIKEIKYIDASDKKVVKFDGFLIVDKFLGYSSKDKSHRWYREIDYALDTPLTNVKRFGDSGPVMQIDSQSDIVEKRGDTQSTAECYMYKTEESTDVIHPSIVTVKAENNYIAEYLNYKEKDKYIFYQRQKIYKCSSPQVGEFLKLVTMIVLRDPWPLSEISDIYYEDGVSVWFDYDTHKEPHGRKLFIREVKFIDFIDRSKVIKFSGKITNIYQTNIFKYDEGTSVEESLPPTPLQYQKQKEKQEWFRNHEKWLSKRRTGHEPIENIIFTPRDMHSMTIQTFIGYIVDVGSKWEKEIGDFNDVYRCTVENIDDYDSSKLMTKIVVHLDEEKMTLDEKITYSDFFLVEKREVYMCINSDGTGSFLRVVTEIKGRIAIKKVNYYNGVKVLQSRIGLGVDTAHIIEQKYLDPTDYKVVKYVGKLEKG